MSLRKINPFRKYRHQGKIYTVDVPFKLKMTKDSEKLIVLIDKSSIHHKFHRQKLWKARVYLENSVGLSTGVRETAESIALCYDLPLAA